MFNFLRGKKNQTQQKFIGKRGYLSVYGIENIYDFIGEDRINKKILEFSTKATMGIRLEELVLGIDKKGFYNKGPIDCMAILLNYFKDSDIIEFLFDKLKDFNEESYMKNTLWSSNRLTEINSLIQIFEKREKNANSTVAQLNELKTHLHYNYYFIDYHFFLIALYRILLTSKELDLRQRIYSSTLTDYLPKLTSIKKSLVDLNIWVPHGLGNSILSALEKYAEETNQNKIYLSYFESATEEGWRF
jgi:hypothetical protein